MHLCKLKKCHPKFVHSSLMHLCLYSVACGSNKSAHMLHALVHIECKRCDCRFQKT
uniref:Uncharacterized protein n=1 Tax=Arundo donax TaxID=35708 RepID=A0A0A9U974_ARUDO